MGGLDQTVQLSGWDQRHVLVPTTIDDYDLPIGLDLLEQAGEVLADVGVAGLTRNGGLLDMYRITVRITSSPVKRFIDQ